MNIKIKSSAVDVPVYFMITAFFAFFLSTLDYSSGKPSVLLTFFLNGIYFYVMAIRPQKCVTMKRNYYIFNLIFMFFAPLQQYVSGTHLWRANGLNIFYKESDYLSANTFILCSALLFEWGYHIGRKTKKIKAEEKEVKYRFSPNTTYSILLICSIVCSALIALTGGLKADEKTSLMRQISNMIIFVPPMCLLISMMDTRKNVRFRLFYVLIFFANSIYILLSFSDVITRFILFGAVMMIISFKMSNYKYRSIYLLIYIIGFFFAFSVLRFVKLSDVESLELVDFRQNDYDAYQMFMMTMRYVKEKGISWGANIASALFCFLPRSFATWRFESTGEIVIEHFGSWFTNVSNPTFSEMYFAFGVLGVIILSVGLGFLIRKIDALCESQNGFKLGVFALISGLSAYLYRGALLATFSYMLGLLIAFFCLYKFTHMKRR